MIQTLKLLIYIDALQVMAFAIFYFCLKNKARRLIKPLDLAIALIIPVLGLFGHYKIIFYAFLFVVPLLSIGNLGHLARRYLLILPLFPGLLEPFTIGSFYLADVSAIDVFNLGALTALALTRNGRARSIFAIDMAVWSFFLVAIILDARGVPLNGAIRSVASTFMGVIPPFYVIARSIKTPRIANEAMLFFALGGFCNAIIAIFETKMTWPLYQEFYYKLHVVNFGLSATLAIRAGHLRAQGALANPATLGLLLALTLIAMLTLGSRFQSAGRWLVMGLVSAGLLACQSRGAWIAAGVGLVLYLLYRRRTAPLMGLAGLAALGAVVLAVVPSDSRIGQMMGRSGDAQWTANYRGDLLHRGLEELATHPLAGQTRGELEVTMDDLRQGEHIIDFVNTHLTVGLEEGLGGLALWLAAWFTPMIVGWRVRRRRAADQDDCPVALPFAMIGACFACLTLTSTIDRMMSLSLLSFGLMSAFVGIARPIAVRSRGAVVPDQPAPSTRLAPSVQPAGIREPA